MNKNRLHPELKKTFSRLPNMTITNKPKLWFFRILMNKMVRLGYQADDQVEIAEHKLSTCSIRIFTPKGVLSGGGLLWIHGGGLIMMSAKSSDADCEAYAKLHKVVVVSVDYRLAPEHPFPAANNDCFESWQWFLANAEKLGVDQNRIAIGGQSAGGGLTAGLCQRILDHGGTQPCAQYLIYPMLDDRTAANQDLDDINHFMWNNHSNRYGWQSFLAQQAGSPSTPKYAVPARREDLSRLPPAWIGIGDIDLFYEEDCDYARRLKEANVTCELHITPKAPHGFEFLAPDASISKAFMQSANSFLAKHIGAT